MRGLLLGALASLALGTAAHGQSDPRLVQAVRTAQEGASDSARGVVRRLLAATPPTDSLYPEILYTQAMVAGDAGEMRRDLQRVVVEYGASSWADDALLRLVQMDYASRSLDGAARNLERLRADYPLTPLIPQAAYWAARVYFDQNNPQPACRWLAAGMARAQDLELQNQLRYLYQRCGTAQAGGVTDTSAGRTDTATAPPSAGPGGARDTTRRDTARAPAPSPPRATADTGGRKPPAPAQRARFRVQVSAVATPGAADEAAERVERLGYQSVIVREGGFYKVRAGAFSSREEAQRAVGRLKGTLGGSPFIVAEP